MQNPTENERQPDAQSGLSVTVGSASDTPETDAEAAMVKNVPMKVGANGVAFVTAECVPAWVARKLEKQRNAAKLWTRIADKLPCEGDVIACCAEHKDGGMMYWAGRVAEVDRGFALMEVLEEEARRFILTFDTHWIPLPPLPNT